jgi:diguanylate cyclase (GGDEF)-like protein
VLSSPRLDAVRRHVGLSRRGLAGARPEARRVWAFITVLVFLAAAGTVYLVAPIAAVPGPVRLAWPLVALGFFAVESKVIVVHFRRETHSFSLSEVPAVVGLFFVSPLEYLLAVIVGSAAALVAARQSTTKLAFNLANFAVIAVLQQAVFHAIGRFGSAPGPIEWTAAFAATTAGSFFSVFAIATAISLSGGAPQFQKLPEMIRFGSIVALANTSLALLAVTVMWIEPSAAWLLLIPLVALFLAYRAYISEREKHEQLELLYESSRILHHSPELDSALVALLDHARNMFRAEIAEVILYPRDRAGDALRTTSLHDGPAEVMVPIPADADDALRQALADHPRARFLDGIELELDAGREIRQAMVSPLLGEKGLIGVIRVANRLTTGTSFEPDDLRLLETLANQAAVALENGQLEQSLAELSRLKEQLRYQAYHDPLTGLANRTMFVEQVDREGAGLGPGRVTAVLFLDLDDFKLVNDTLGHAAGDRLLGAVADRIRGCIRGEDLAARLGGDEFAILVRDDDALVRATAIAERIIAGLVLPFLIHGHELTIGGSIGIAIGRGGQRADELLRNADVAMYTAKAGGKRRLAMFDPTMHEAIVARHALSAELSKSVGRGELVVHYQPIVSLTTGKAVAAEALVRWRHPTRGLIAPDDFIPLAEDSGVIFALGQWVLAEACRQAAEWSRDPSFPEDFAMSINLSPNQLQRPEFIREIEAVLARTGLSPKRLILELTETVMFQDTEATTAKLQILRGRGVRIAVDDFGTGYSSLGYLRKFPVDILKIAREFVVPGDRDPSEWAFAHAIVALGRTLGLDILAEGIEHPAQVARLVAMGCELGQGYHFAHPMEPADLQRAISGGAWPAAEGAAPGRAAAVLQIREASA